MRRDGGTLISFTLRQVYLPTRQVLSPTISALFSMQTHQHMDLLMEGSGFWVRGSAVNHWSSFSDSMNHGSNADGKNKDSSPSESFSLDTTTHGKAPFKMSAGYLP